MTKKLVTAGKMTSKKTVTVEQAQEQMASLAKKNGAPLALTTQIEKGMGGALTGLATLLGSELPVKQLAPLFSQMKEWEKNLTDLAKVGRARLLDTLDKRGEVVTEAGTRRATVDGWVLEARPQKTALDAGRVEALLRAKSLDVTAHMDSVISYKVNLGKLDQLISEGVLTADELATCRPELSYALQTPKQE